jgi:hypothetical protein
MIRHKSLQEIDRRRKNCKSCHPRTSRSCQRPPLCHGTHWNQPTGANLTPLLQKSNKWKGRPSPTSPLQGCLPSIVLCVPAEFKHFTLYSQGTVPPSTFTLHPMNHTTGRVAGSPIFRQPCFFSITSRLYRNPGMALLDGHVCESHRPPSRTSPSNCLISPPGALFSGAIQLLDEAPYRETFVFGPHRAQAWRA